MPVRNESAYIERSLGSVLAQSHGLDRMEILVIDGRSDDDTRERVEALAEEHPEATIRVLDNPGRIAPTALNVGLRQARGEILVRVDGHCEIGPDYVANGVRHLLSGAADGVGGPLETVGETATARAIALAMGSRFGVGNSAFRTLRPGGPPRQVDTVAFPAYTRQALERNGPFDEELVRNQDDEYNYRLRSRGGRLLLVGDMPARYYSRGTFRSLFRQYFQYGVYKVRVLQKHPRQMSARQFVPPAFVAALGCSALAAPWLGPWPFTAVGGAWLLACTAVVVSVMAEQSWNARARRAGPLPIGELMALGLRLPLAYALLHLGYGSGFLVGLLRFAGRWQNRHGTEDREKIP